MYAARAPASTKAAIRTIWIFFFSSGDMAVQCTSADHYDAHFRKNAAARLALAERKYFALRGRYSDSKSSGQIPGPPREPNGRYGPRNGSSGHFIRRFDPQFPASRLSNSAFSYI